MPDLGSFIADCLTAVRLDPTHKAVAEVMRERMNDHSAFLAEIGEPTEPGLIPLYKSPELTIINVVWKPEMVLMPHDHAMWAVIGLYTGREDNIFWRQLEDNGGPQIEAAGARSMGPGDVTPLGKDVIHSVTNPLGKLTGAIHVYGGDFFEAERLEWEAEGLTSRRWDPERTKALFEN